MVANSRTTADWLGVSEDTKSINKITRHFLPLFSPFRRLFQLLLTVINLHQQTDRLSGALGANFGLPIVFPDLLCG
jgi:hypothetical protein